VNYDVVIIGGGPAGLSCALYTSRARLSTIILDRASGGGALAHSTKIANYPGVPGPVAGSQILDTIRMQATGFGAEYRKAAVMAVVLHDSPKIVYTTDATYEARALVIATGAMGRSDRIDGEEKFLGRGVSYCAACDAAFYAGRTVGVVGHNVVAVEEALFLARFADKVEFVCPKSNISAPIDLLRDLDSLGNVETHTNLMPRRIVGGDSVSALVVRSRNGEVEMPMDGVFVLLSGVSPITDFLGGALEVNGNGCIIVDNECATSMQGVYAVGDVTCIHPKQAIIAAAEGVIAALSVDKYLSGRDIARADYM